MGTHKNVCRLIDSFVGNKNGYKLYLVMEYCDKGDFDQFLERNKSMAQVFAYGNQ